MFFFPGFHSSSPMERRRAATGEGAGKKHLITGVSLLVTRRWQRLPWVSRFRERRVFCLEARGLQRSLPRLGGQPGLPEPVSTRASAPRPPSPQASLAPYGWRWPEQRDVCTAQPQIHGSSPARQRLAGVGTCTLARGTLGCQAAASASCAGHTPTGRGRRPSPPSRERGLTAP